MGKVYGLVSFQYLSHVGERVETDMSTAEAPKAELTSILTQVQTLQTDREKLMKELELAKQTVEKLTEGKRAEMKTALDTVVAKWLEDSVADEAIMSQFKDGMERLVKIQLRIRVCSRWSCAHLQLTCGGSTRWRSCGQSTRSSRRA